MDDFVKGLLKMNRKSLEREFRDSPDQHKNTIYTLVEMVRQDVSPEKMLATAIFKDLTSRMGVQLTWSHDDVAAAIAAWTKLAEAMMGAKRG